MAPLIDLFPVSVLRTNVLPQTLVPAQVSLRRTFVSARLTVKVLAEASMLAVPTCVLRSELKLWLSTFMPIRLYVPPRPLGALASPAAAAASTICCV